MKVGYFDRNTLCTLCFIIRQLAPEGINCHYIDKLSYLKGDNSFDLLLVNPGLAEEGWKRLSECVETHPQMKFIVFLTTESQKCFDENNFKRFPNVEACLTFDITEKLTLLFEEMQS